MFIVLIGHGTHGTSRSQPSSPRYGPQGLTDLVAGIQGLVQRSSTRRNRVFLPESLTRGGPRRITATVFASQKYANRFPEYVRQAMKWAPISTIRPPHSIFEVFTAASAAVKQHYEQRGQLTTERALLDDNGDGKGREATAEGPDGGIARIAYLDSEVVNTSANPELAELVKRRRGLEQQAEEHKELRGVMPEAEWQKTFEKLMLELAQVSAEIRKKS